MALGLADETVKGTLMTLVVAIGIYPLASVTTGCQEPATAVTVQVMVVDPVTKMFVQATFENCIVLMMLGRPVPVIVRVVPLRVKPVI